MEESEPYVMPSFTKLLVENLPRAVTFYEGLGFKRLYQDAVFVHLRWTRYADLYLVAAPKGVTLPSPRGAGVLICYSVGDEGVTAIAERARAAGAKVEGPASTPWHTKEVIVTDPEGYRLNFAQPASPSSVPPHSERP